MKLLALSVSEARDLVLDGKPVRTGICKKPVEHRLAARRHGIEGDGQADLDAHGGINKAVYGYPFEHYPHWEHMFKSEFPPGQFGENLTTVGLLEDAVHVGDLFRIGTAVLQAAQPRMPCFKLGLRMASAKFVKIFMNSGRPGIYFTVEEEGEIGPGDPIVPLETGRTPFSVRQIWDMCHNAAGTVEEAAAALQLKTLGREWRKLLENRLQS